jgi:hypothetical protein
MRGRERDWGFLGKIKGGGRHGPIGPKGGAAGPAQGGPRRGREAEGKKKEKKKKNREKVLFSFSKSDLPR